MPSSNDRQCAKGGLAAATWLWLVLGAGCGSNPGNPSLRVDAVEPSSVPYSLESQVVVRGLFQPRLDLNVSGSGSPTLADVFTVELSGMAAKAVSLTSQEALLVTLPRELPPGRHSVQVTGPSGQEVTVQDALEVVAQAPARIAFVTSMRAARESQWTEPIQIELRDAQGRPTVANRLLAVKVRSDAAVNRLLLEGTAREQESIELTLVPGERGFSFTFSSPVVGYHTLSAVAEDFEPISQPVVVGVRGDAAQARFRGERSPLLTAGVPTPVMVEIQDAGGGPAGFPPSGIRLEVRVPAPLGVALEPAGPFLPSQVLVLHEGTGQATLYVQGTLAAADLVLEASATNLDTGGALAPDSVTSAVRPGAVDHFEVRRAGSGDALAGASERFSVRAVDGFGNTVTEWSGPVSLRSGELPTAPTLGGTLTPAGDGSFLADVVFTRAGQAALTVADQSSPPHLGSSSSFNVLPGPFATLAVSTPASPRVAGAPFPVTVRAVDAYGNQVASAHQVSLSGAGLSAGALSPATSGAFQGAITLSVTITQAVANTVLTASEGAASVARSGSFAVLPGPTQVLTVSNAGAIQTAGVPFSVTLRALDAFGNETLDATDAALSAPGVDAGRVLPASTGPFTGHLTLQVAVTQAASGLRLFANDPQVAGQQTATFDVRPGPLAGFGLNVPACVSFSASFPVTVEAQDAYGNRVPSYTGSVQLDSTIGFSPAKPPAFTQGSVTILAARIGYPGTAPRTVALLATDRKDPSKTGTVMLNVRPACP